MSLIIQAAQFADRAHRGQFRKWSDGVPYIVHPSRVAARVSIQSWATEEAVAAAWLHDVIEDCGIASEDLADLFGVVVARHVVDLTNVSKRDYPHLNRAAIHQFTLQKLRADTLPTSRMIKLIDRIDNLSDSVNAPAKFLKLYIQESRELLVAIGGVDQSLGAELSKAIELAERSIK